MKSTGREKGTRRTGKRPPKTGWKEQQKTKHRQIIEGEKRRISKIQRNKEKRTMGGQEQQKPSPYSSHAIHLGREDWEPWQEREEAEKECVKTGHISQPENDWGIAERQGEDRARAEANAANRQRREWEEQGRDHCGDFPGAAIIVNATRRWIGNQGRGATDEQEERENHLRGKLAEAELENRRGKT